MMFGTVMPVFMANGNIGGEVQPVVLLVLMGFIGLVVVGITIGIIKILLRRKRSQK